LWPIFLVVLAVPILNEKMTAKKIFGVILGFLGFLFLVFQQEGFTLDLSNWLPFIAILYSGVSWVMLFLFLKRLKYESLSATLILIFFATILYGTATFATATPLVISLPILFAAAYFGVITIGLANGYYAHALRHLDTAHVGNLSYLVPVMAIFWASLFLGETIQWYYFVTLALIFAGYLIQRYGES
jgi:drug/metabolite transporter (DMT)-like permease